MMCKPSVRRPFIRNRRHSFFLLSTVILLCINSIISVIITTAAHAFDAKEAPSAYKSTCQLYLAPSSLSSSSTDNDYGYAKLGMFAGADFNPDTTIGQHEMVIHLINLAAHTARASTLSVNNSTNTCKTNKDQDQEEEEEEAVNEECIPTAVNNDGNTIPIERSTQSLLSFLWSAEITGGKFEDTDEVLAAIPGYGAFINTHPNKLYNIEWDKTSILFRKGIRNNDDNSERELFYPGRGAYTTFYNMSIKSTEYIQAGMELFLDYFAVDIDDDDDDESSGRETKREKSYHDNDDLNSMSKKDLTWLQAHGQCLDNIRAGPSTIPHAGHGAFATRFIPKGELVSPIPLVHVSENVMNMYNLSIVPTLDANGNYINAKQVNEIIGKQLLLNYCFGHAESSILLCSFGTGSNFINHKKGIGSDGANAKVIWASNSKILQPDWFEVPTEILVTDDKYNLGVGLMFDIVAAEDIHPNEEIFIDYGSDWEEAWDTHVKNWAGKIEREGLSAKWPIRAIDLNEEFRNKPFKTPEEHEKDPYPEGVMTACFIMFEEDEEPITGRYPGDKGVIERYPGDQGVRIIRWNEGDEPEVYSGEFMRECEVVVRIKVRDPETSEFAYKYMVNARDDEEGEMIVKNVPHRAILFVDKPLEGNQHFKDAFRHYIGIPDEIFPRAWRDKRQDSKG